MYPMIPERLRTPWIPTAQGLTDFISPPWRYQGSAYQNDVHSNEREGSQGQVDDNSMPNNDLDYRPVMQLFTGTSLASVSHTLNPLCGGGSVQERQ